MSRLNGDELESKIWWRFLKVVYIVAYCLVVIIVGFFLSLAISDYKYIKYNDFIFIFIFGIILIAVLEMLRAISLYILGIKDRKNALQWTSSRIQRFWTDYKYKNFINKTLEILFTIIGILILLHYSSIVWDFISKNFFSVTKKAGAVINKPNPTVSWKLYTNDRYGFKINYPNTWPIGKEAINGDGLSLYSGGPDIHISVYGTNSPYPYSASDSSVEINALTLNDGRQATTLMERKDGKTVYTVFFNVNHEGYPTQQYVFSAEVPDQFFNENKDILVEVAKSLTLTGSGYDVPPK